MGTTSSKTPWRPSGKAKKLIGYLPEQPPLYMDMTVDEYMQFICDVKRIRKTSRKSHLDEIYDLVRIGDVRKRLIRNLSKGYKQRVGLAQAILGFPSTIILDEPTVGLDPKQILEIRALIRELAQEHTVILSSHILSEIRAVCDRVLIIRKGKFVACDTPEALEGKLSAGGSLELEVRADADQVAAVLGHPCLERLVLEFVVRFRFFFRAGRQHQ